MITGTTPNISQLLQNTTTFHSPSAPQSKSLRKSKPTAGAATLSGQKTQQTAEYNQELQQLKQQSLEDQNYIQILKKALREVVDQND